MKNKLSGIGGTLVAIVLLGLCAWYAMKGMPLSGECSALSQIPMFGSKLPTQNLGEIRYVGGRINRRVYAKVDTTNEEFERVASQLGLSVIRYKMGFDAADLQDIDGEFRPVGNQVSCAYGALNKNGRGTVRLFFEPSSDGSTNGVMYIHIS